MKRRPVRSCTERARGAAAGTGRPGLSGRNLGRRPQPRPAPGLPLGPTFQPRPGCAPQSPGRAGGRQPGGGRRRLAGGGRKRPGPGPEAQGLTHGVGGPAPQGVERRRSGVPSMRVRDEGGGRHHRARCHRANPQTSRSLRPAPRSQRPRVSVAPNRPARPDTARLPTNNVARPVASPAGRVPRDGGPEVACRSDFRRHHRRPGRAT